MRLVVMAKVTKTDRQIDPHKGMKITRRAQCELRVAAEQKKFRRKATPNLLIRIASSVST